MNDVRIFEISNGGYSGPRWLCPRHIETRVAAKWSVKPSEKRVPHDLMCDDCVREAPTDNRPVDFVPTTADPPPRRKTKAEEANRAPVGMFDESEAA